jgi:hypothetical protein
LTGLPRLFRLPLFQCIVLILLTLALRIASASGPYFVDAARHIHAIESGKLVIHTPGYFLFNASGFAISHLLHVSAGSALHILNVTFSVTGVAVSIFFFYISRSPHRRSGYRWHTPVRQSYGSPETSIVPMQP